MPTLHVELPDELSSRLMTRAVAAGFSSIEQYARAVLEATAEGQLDDDDVEDLLARRVSDPRPGIEFTPEFAEEFRREVSRRRGTP